MVRFKKPAFTLAEILISLGLIGILSTMAIQTMQRNDHSAEFDALRNKAVMNVQSSMHQAMYDATAAEILSDASASDNDAYIAKLWEKVTALLNVKGTKTKTNGLGTNWAFAPSSDFDESTFYGMRDGVYFAYDIQNTGTYGGAVSRVAVDVNAAAGPNEENKDQVLLYMDRFGNLTIPIPPSSGCEEPEVWISACNECKNPADCPTPKIWQSDGAGGCECDCPPAEPNWYNGTCNECPEGETKHETCGCIEPPPPDGEEYELINCEWVKKEPVGFDCQKEGGTEYVIDGVTYCYDCKDKTCNDIKNSTLKETLDRASSTCLLPKVGAYALVGNEYSDATSGLPNSVPCYVSNEALANALGCAREPGEKLWTAFDNSKRFAMLQDASGNLQWDYFEPKRSRHAYGHGCQYIANNQGAGYEDAMQLERCRSKWSWYTAYSYLGWPGSNRDGYMNSYAEKLLKDVDGAINGINQARIADYRNKMKNPECVEQVCDCPEQKNNDVIPVEMEPGLPDINNPDSDVYLFVSAKFVHNQDGITNKYDIVVWASHNPNGGYPIANDVTVYDVNIQIAVADKTINLNNLRQGKNVTWFTNDENQYTGLTKNNMRNMIKINSANLGDKGYKVEVKGWSDSAPW